MDEFVVLIYFFYAFVLHAKRKKILLLLILLFIISGCIGNIILRTPSITVALGAFNTLKPILLFWAFAQIDFEWRDLQYLFKLFCGLFYIVFVAYILDFLWPGFRDLFGRRMIEDAERGGMRALCGIFYRPTYATIWGLIYFLYYRFYTIEKPIRWKYYFAISMQIFSLKVKDLLGFFAGIGSVFFKRISQSRILISGFSMMIAFSLYATIMPAHYNRYFGEMSDDSNIARVALTYTSGVIAKDYFPFGVGFGMYASPTSRQTESPVYWMYGIDRVYGLDFIHDGGRFMCDSFWPMLLGETGILGTIIYIIILYYCFAPFFKLFLKNTANRNVLMPCFLFIVLLVETIGKPTLVGPPHSLVVWGIAGIFCSLKDKTYPYKIY